MVLIVNKDKLLVKDEVFVKLYIIITIVVAVSGLTGAILYGLVNQLIGSILIIISIILVVINFTILMIRFIKMN